MSLLWKPVLLKDDGVTPLAITGTPIQQCEYGLDKDQAWVAMSIGPFQTSTSGVNTIRVQVPALIASALMPGFGERARSCPLYVNDIKETGSVNMNNGGAPFIEINRQADANWPTGENIYIFCDLGYTVAV